MPSKSSITKRKATIAKRCQAQWAIGTLRIVHRLAQLNGLSSSDVIAALPPSIFNRVVTTPAHRRRAITAACRAARAT